MSSPAAARVVRHVARNATRLARQAQTSRHSSRLYQAPIAIQSHVPASRHFSVFQRNAAGLMPDQENPAPPQEVPEEAPPTQPTPIDDDEYHTRSDEWMNAINEKAEAMQEEREDVEVEYSVGLLSQFSKLYHANKLSRPAFSPSRSPNKAPTSSTNSRPQNRSGCLLPSQVPSDTTGCSTAKGSTRKRAAGRANGCISEMAAT